MLHILEGAITLFLLPILEIYDSYSNYMMIFQVIFVSNDISDDIGIAP